MKSSLRPFDGHGPRANGAFFKPVYTTLAMTERSQLHLAKPPDQIQRQLIKI